MPVSKKEVELAKSRRQEFKGALTWRQGAFWVAIKEPYETKDDIAYFHEPPEGAVVQPDAKRAYETIQQLKGAPPTHLRIDMGIMDVGVKKPSQSPGTKGAIGFTRDVEQKTTGDITLGEHHLRRNPEHTSDISLRRNPKDTKEVHEAEAKAAEAKAKEAGEATKKTKVKVVKVRQPSLERQRGKPLTRGTTPLVRHISTGKGRGVDVEMVPSKEGKGSPKGKVTAHIEPFKIREPRSPRSTMPKPPKGSGLGEYSTVRLGNDIIQITEKSSGVKMLKRATTSTSRKKRRRRLW